MLQRGMSLNPNWRGGRVYTGSGYVKIKMPDHPFCDNHGYVREHRLVWEKHNDAILLPWGHVHHKNGIKDDNRIENLEAMTISKHRSHHCIEHNKQYSIPLDRICFLCNRITYGGWIRIDPLIPIYKCSNCYLNEYRKRKKQNRK